LERSLKVRHRERYGVTMLREREWCSRVELWCCCCGSCVLFKEKRSVLRCQSRSLKFSSTCLDKIPTRFLLFSIIFIHSYVRLHLYMN